MESLLQASNQRKERASSEEPVQQSAPPIRQRRPANGFLGFCHVHRVIVSKKNKKIENRLVTKILGNWWATLTDEQKAPYEDRAREFKESFLAANPGFKWYTPRESTGNTPVTRQSNRRGRKLESSALASGSAITPGKLADESQMGTLSKLMVVQKITKRASYETSYIDSEHDYLPAKPPIVNNNTIMAGDRLPCSNGGCAHHNDEGVDILVPYAKDMDLDKEEETRGEDSNGGKPEEEGPTVEEDDGSASAFPEFSPEGTGSSAKKRKASKPKKNAAPATESASKIPHHLSFKDFMKVCPVYQYEVFLQKKAELSKCMKKSLSKRRKRQVQVHKRTASETAAGGSANPVGFRRRRKGRSVRMPAAKTSTRKLTKTVTPGATEDSDQAVRPMPPFGIDLLLTAAKRLDAVGEN